MIVSNLTGGLGNQMFQYAYARSLSLKYELPVKFHYERLPGQTLHNGLEIGNVFGLQLETATKGDLRKALGFLGRSSLIRRLAKGGRARWLLRSGVFFDNCVDHWQNIESPEEGIYLQGYWQSEKYFRMHESEIRSDFSFVQKLIGQNQRLSEQIRECESVSIHVRRGDYISNKKTLAFHGVCSIDYYNCSVKMILDRYPNAVFFVFSDDLGWVERFLRPILPNAVIVAHNQGDSSYIDMQLMSECKHNIIANSSFSWWGAWLNDYKDKIVVAPKSWFRSQSSGDLIPKEWIQL